MADNNDKNQMSFWDHLAALRLVVLKIMVLLLVVGTVAFCFMPWIFDHIILAPCQADFPLYHWLSMVKGDGTFAPDMSKQDFSVHLINIELASQFFIHMSASIWAALLVCFPFVIYILWGFISPGLYQHERRGARKAFLFGNIMFYTGILVGYFIVFPMALRFLADYHLSDAIDNTVSLASYMDSFYMLVFMMGLLFELPLLSWMLGKMGILKRSFFKRYRKYAFFAIILLCAIITPTSDLVTLAVVFIPVYGLWEFSALLVPKATPEQNTQNQD